MILASSPSARRVLLSLAAIGLSGCAASLPDVEPVDIPRLEQAVASSPANTNLQVQLGMAQFKAADYETARGTLQGAIDAGNESGAAFLYLGMVHEELEDWSGARDAYNQYLVLGSSNEAIAQVRDRLALIGQNLLRTQAQQALAQEAELTTAAVTPQSVAVLPLGFNSDNEDLEPLIYALSDMMVTDFKVSNALVVLERAQIQSLLNEMALESSGYALPGTGARAGRMLSAEHVFQGVLTTLGDNDLQTDADVLNVPSAASAGTLSESAVLESLFDMEKQIVIRTIREVLGVELTPAEEQAILENRRQNVLAFLAYGRGLRELDQGNYSTAQAEFQTAISLEPGTFTDAEAALAQTSALIGAQNQSTSALATVASNTGETGTGGFGPPSANTTNDLGDLGIGPPPTPGQDPVAGQVNTLRSMSEGIDPTRAAGLIDLGSATLSQDQTTQQTNDTSRDPINDGSNDNTLGSGAGAQIRIVIRRPGGGQ